MHLRPTESAVLTYLHETKGASNVSSESLLAIGLHVGRSAASIQNAIKRLSDKGLIRNIRRGRKTSKGVYQLTPEGLKMFTIKGGQNPITKSCSFGASRQLPDLFRTPYFRNAGRLHQVAPKGQLVTRSEVIDLGVIRTRQSASKYLNLLGDLPAPLVTVHQHPKVAGQQLYEFHELTDEIERVNVEYLALIPGASPKTFDQHAEENDGKRQRYATFIGGIPDMERVYEEQVKPLLVTDSKHLGCEIFTGSLGNSGYGSIKHGRTWLGAHRVAWEAETGHIPPGMDLHHLCGVRACCSIFHLLPVSREDHLKVHQGESIGFRMPVVGNACRELVQAT